MQGFDSLIGRDADITPEQYKLIDVEIQKAARQKMVARKLFPTPSPPLGLGKQVYSYDLLTEMSDAILSHIFEDEEDAINLTRNNVPIPINQKGFRIHRRDLEASKTYGEPLDTVNGETAAYKVQKKEEDLLILGWAKIGSTYDINGLYNAASLDYSTTKDFGTAGNGPVAVSAAIALMEAQNITGPYNVCLHPTQKNQLNQYTANHSLTNYREVLDLLEGGQIISTPAMTEAKGFVSAAGDHSHFKLKVAQDLLTEFRDWEGKGVKGRVFKCVTPVVYDGNAICKMSDI